MAIQWLTTTPISGSSGTTQVSVVPQNNTGTTTRTGTLTVTASRFGRTKTVTVDVSQKKEERDYSKRYFTTRSLENSNTISFIIPSDVTSSQATSISYSMDNGSTWTTTMIDGTSKTITVSGVSSGQTVLWKGIADGWGNKLSSSNSAIFQADKDFEIDGNIMSLLYGDNFSGQTALNRVDTFCTMFSGSKLINTENLVLPATTLTDHCYFGMFGWCTGLTTTPELPATTLASYCYDYMFAGCNSLTTAPVLPATTLASNCYLLMFYNCTSLTAAPSLPATTLVNDCYNQMFYGCTSLTTAPSVLPATTLASGCYYNMFSGCIALTTAPELPATSLTEYCYAFMFNGCTSLTTAPVLPATTLVSYCYYTMFSGCTSLNYIRCLATSISAFRSTMSWVAGVSNSGTFEKASGVTWPSGASGIPNNWTVVEV